MRFALTVSLLLHLTICLLVFGKYEIPKISKSIPKPKYEKIKIQTGSFGDPDSKKPISSGEGRKSYKNYQDLLSGTRQHLSKRGTMPLTSGEHELYSKGFRHDVGQLGMGVKFGKNLDLSIPLPLFVLKLNGGEESETVIERCADKIHWRINRLDGDPLLRAYLFEKILKETLFVDNFVFLKKVTYQHLKITLQHVRRTYHNEGEYQQEMDGNHYTVKLFSQDKFTTPDVGTGFDHFKQKMVYSKPGEVDISQILKRLYRKWFKKDEEEDERHVLSDGMFDSIEKQIRTSIARTVRRLKRSPAYMFPEKAMAEFTCLNSQRIFP